MLPGLGEGNVGVYGVTLGKEQRPKTVIQNRSEVVVLRFIVCRSAAMIGPSSANDPVHTSGSAFWAELVMLECIKGGC